MFYVEMPYVLTIFSTLTSLFQNYYYIVALQITEVMHLLKDPFFQIAESVL